MTKSPTSTICFRTTEAIKDAVRTMAQHDRRTVVGQLEWLVCEEQRRRELAAAMPTREQLDAQLIANADREELHLSRFRPVARVVNL
jgi:hypothetical protein